MLSQPCRVWVAGRRVNLSVCLWVSWLVRGIRWSIGWVVGWLLVVMASAVAGAAADAGVNGWLSRWRWRR